MTALSTIEPIVTAIWRDILELDAVDRDENLFDLGGTSLAAMRMAARISEALDVHVSMDVILRDATLASIVSAIDRLRGETVSRGTTEV